MALDGIVREVDFGCLDDIPALLENVASELREGRHGKVLSAAAVFVNEEGVPIVCGWGADTDSIRAMGLLHLGASWLAAHEVRRR